MTKLAFSLSQFSEPEPTWQDRATDIGIPTAGAVAGTYGGGVLGGLAESKLFGHHLKNSKNFDELVAQVILRMQRLPLIMGAGALAGGLAGGFGAHKAYKHYKNKE